jgi:hypothetical protein
MTSLLIFTGVVSKSAVTILVMQELFTGYKALCFFSLSRICLKENRSSRIFLRAQVVKLLIIR